MEEEEAESSFSAAGLPLALLALVVVPALALLAASRWRRAAARREEVRRLARLAAEESELAEREAALAYYSELFPGVVQAAEVPEAPPQWGPPPGAVAAPGPAREEYEPQPQPPVGAKGVCAVCFRPTTFRCKQCKAVKYCSFKCQIAHWRQGHKDECRPPNVNTRPDDEGKVEQGRAAEENALVGVKPAVEMNNPGAVASETSDANHSLKSPNGQDKHMPSKEVCSSTEVPGGHQSNSTVEFFQNGPVSVDNNNMGSNIAHSNSVQDVSSTKDFNDALPRKSQASAPKISDHNSFVNKEPLNRSKEHHRAKNASLVEDGSQTSHNRELEDSSVPQAAASVVLEPKSSKTPVQVELERSKTEPAGNGNIQSTKPAPSALTVDKATVRGGYSVTPNLSKVSDNLSDGSYKPSERSGSTANNLATSLKKMVRQQTTSKVVRHYPSESTLFPYELFVKLYGKVELHPFGLHNLGNSCYANAVLQCLMFTRPLTTYLLEGLHSKNCSKKEWCFMCEFEKLIVEGKRRKTALSPTGILSHLHDIGSSFGPGKQEDAHEFLRYAIDAMQSVCMKEARKGALRSAEETTLVQLIFGGYLRSKIKCSKCHGSSEQCEPMLDLTVEIDGDISSLDEALERFTTTEVLDGENRYHCSRCKSYERAKKKLTIEEAPNVLTIALKRYQSGKFGKISKAIRFPETLNVGSYMSPNTDDTSPVYSLYAVVVHHDVMNAAFSGHYVCYVKDTQGRWFKADDSQVKQVSLDNIMSKCAYMLLYARCSPRAPSSVRQAMAVQDPARQKKAKQKGSLGGTTRRGGSFNRHQDGQRHTDQDGQRHTHASDEYGYAPYPPAESPSPSESSSLFSNSDAGSHSTVSTDSSDSTRNSTSTEEYEYLFGASDQMYRGAPVENDYPTYSRSRSSLNTSSSGREAHEHGLREGVTRGGWVEGDEGASLLYTDRSKQQLGSSKLTDQYRQLDRSGHDPGETRGGVLLRRPSRDRTAQTFY